MILDVNEILHDSQTALIILRPTGVFYTAQTGGVGCDHPKAEGILLPMPEWMQEFDDCSYGCQHLWQDEAARTRLADDLDAFFAFKRHDFIQIDRDRLRELSEGWWPVIYNAPIGDSFVQGQEPGPFKGYIYTGNCD